MNKQCVLLSGFLVLVIAAGAYKFLFQGSVSTSSDGRIAILLNTSERDLVLAEMRAFLLSTQVITKGIIDKDMKLVAEYARQVGRAAQAAVPGTLVGKLPMEFKKLGFDTHTKFDQLALDAEEFGDAEQALSQLSNVLQNCVTCHAAYRIIQSDE